ncbi:MAG: DUF2059 domain-containing protein [Bacteroidaceae bacterium]|nr:DUF2059 domain-containing protein [Bacteroidaceae bacterium]
MKRIQAIVFALLLAVSLPLGAQNSYSRALTRYVRSNRMACVVPPESLRKNLTELTDRALKDKKGFATATLVDYYMREQFMPDMVQFALLPAYSKHVVESELNQLSKLYETPAGKAFVAHMLEWQKRMDPVVGELLSWQAEEMDQGNELLPIDPDPGCPKEYIDLYYTYYDLARPNAALNAMEQSETYRMGNDELRKIFDTMLPYLRANLRIISLNMAYGVLTEDDLRFGKKVASTEAYQRATDASVEAACTMQTANRLLYMKYLDWLTK